MPTPDASQFIQMKKYRAIDNRGSDTDSSKKTTHLYNWVPSATQINNFLPSFSNKITTGVKYFPINYTVRSAGFKQNKIVSTTRFANPVFSGISFTIDFSDFIAIQGLHFDPGISHAIPSNIFTITPTGFTSSVSVSFYTDFLYVDLNDVGKSKVRDCYIAAGLSLSNPPTYLFFVNCASGSTPATYARIYWAGSGMFLTIIDESANFDKTLPGTFNFPMTFTFTGQRYHY
jgi:hypothetical protein